MLYLKKYLTEGLIQFTILLSLIGVQVDVDSYLSSELAPLREIILGPSSAYTQTQFHQLRGTLDGYGVHRKSAELDGFFTRRRLLSRVRSLDRLSVPSTQLDAWLVHHDADAAVSAGGQPGPAVALENGGGGPEDAENPESSAMRGGGGGATLEPDYAAASEDSLAAVAPQDEQEQGGSAEHDRDHDLTKEDMDLIDILWRQDMDLGAGREVFDYSGRPKESETEERPPAETQQEEEGGAEREESWRNGLNLREGQACTQVDGETGEDVPEQFSGTVSPELGESGGEGPSTSRGFMPSPLLPRSDPPLDLEQQWLDIMAIMELQDMEVNSDGDGSFPEGNSDGDSGSSRSGVEAEPLVTFGLSGSATPINRNVSLHQASMPSCSQDLPAFFSPGLESCVSMETPEPHPPTLLGLSSSNSSNFSSTFSSTNLTGLFLPPLLNGSGNGTAMAALADPLSALLEEAMLDEISLLDLALQEGFSHTQASRLGEQLDSDSGLSLDSGHSPVSPSSSETSCSSGSSSCSSSSASFSEEGAMGHSTDSEAVGEAEEGAVGGYRPEHSKFCRLSYRDPSRFHGLPRLEHVGHNHTYNLPLSPSGGPEEEPQPPRARRQDQLRPRDVLDKQASRDERRARSMKIPFSTDKIVNLPVEEFNQLLTKHGLSEAQLALVRDIRRRGKNKMAAQNCRRRKLDTMVGLERGVEELRRDKARLLRDRAEFGRSLRQMKHRLQGLSSHVFARLRDPAGRPYAPADYALQIGSDGSVLVVPRRPAGGQGRKPQSKQKDKKK
ncbi:endoplasmic reticulum membrane sensor NFE2L1-like isoform X2 [Anguilla rostrata]|uniref:endoplasmic reticulum membrane sensor NFE2L1-like isoform X2 n=1 Tax=Anguilla rostrata TaxID=7938 RepID=UPI0030D23AB0